MDNNTLAVIAALLGGGGLGGTIIALYKVKPEANKLVIDAAQTAVVVQSGVIDSLTDELARMEKQHQRCEDRLTKLETAFRAIDERKNFPPTE